MIQPDAIPVRIARSRIALAAPDVAALFGKGYALRGAERVLVSRTGTREVSVPVAAAKSTGLVLDALDRDALGDGPPLRLRGPAGSVAAPTAEPVRRALALPAGLIRAWRLDAGRVVTVQAGAVAFGDVIVEEGDGHVRLDRADALAAGLADGDTVRWNAQLVLASPPLAPTDAAAPKVRATGRLITENDVRQARLKGQKIVLGPGHIITPAARSLGRELGVLLDA
ncbi:MAG: hypothetical protein ABJF88_14435 [Rhodothermales bacterium]